MYALFKQINQTTELRAMLKVFLHIFLYDSQPVLGPAGGTITNSC